MLFSLDDSEAELVIESLAHYAERYRRIANDVAAGYPPETQKNQLAIAVTAHDLAKTMSDQVNKIKENRNRFPARSEQQRHDVYEVKDWDPNDPRNW
tara:strand:- start:434 stop:724 length:291 start_codon:yes stop_codon:yes gene_type:complete